MARAIWKGDISFGLVSIPISLISTEENQDIHLHLLNAKTNSRVRYKRVDEETGKEVPWNDIVKGYEYDKGNYIIVNEEAFEQADPVLFKTIDIEEFVDAKEIDSLYYNKPYYILPEGKNKKAYVLLREALKKTHKVGVAKTILRTKEYLSLILPHRYALLLYLVHFTDELVTEDDINVPNESIKTYKITDKEIKMSVDLINDMSAKWQPEKYHNDYRDTLQQWLNQQTQAVTRSSHKQSKPLRNQDPVIDFVSLLKESMKKQNINSKAKSKTRVKK